MRNTQRTAVIVAVLGLLAFILAACHTVEGAGKDIQSTGEAIQDAAN